jgi:hypothetical protein
MAAAKIGLPRTARTTIGGAWSVPADLAGSEKPCDIKAYR